MTLTLHPVSSRRDLRRFVTFPWRIYRSDPNWVPPLISEQMRKLDAARNPFWRNADRMLWIAMRDGKPAGTIAAIVENGRGGDARERLGTFGFFECVQDARVANALLERGAEWLRSRGMTLMRGPYNPSGTDEVGLLIEGHDTRPALVEAHTPPYYVDLVVGAGFEKHLDTMAWLASAPPGARDFDEAMSPKLVRVAQWAATRPGVRLRTVDLSRWDEEVGLACRLFNDALSTLQGHLPVPEAEFRSFADSFKPFIIPKAAVVAEVDGTPAAFALALPDLNEALQHANGRLWPTGALKIWWHSRRLTRATFKILMVLPEYRRRGLEALLIATVGRALWDAGYREADLSLTGEENENIQNYLAGLGMRVYRRYRVFQKRIG